jgi:hypothetical protein
MTIDYRRLARAFGGSDGQPRPRKLTTGSEPSPASAEPPLCCPLSCPPLP